MKPTGDSLRRISDERLADLEYHARLYNNNLALTGKDALDLIADLRDSREIVREAAQMLDADRRTIDSLRAQVAKAEAALRHLKAAFGTYAEVTRTCDAYFDANARETKREGAE